LAHCRFNDGTQTAYCAGYVNSTSAVDAINFKFASGNFDGTIKQYGLVAS